MCFLTKTVQVGKDYDHTHTYLNTYIFSTTFICQCILLTSTYRCCFIKQAGLSACRCLLLILPFPYYCNACVSNECSLSIKNGGEKKHTRPFCSNKHRPFDCSGRVARSNEIRAAIGLSRLTSSNPNTRKGLTKHICHRHKSLL